MNAQKDLAILGDRSSRRHAARGSVDIRRLWSLWPWRYCGGASRAERNGCGI